MPEWLENYPYQHRGRSNVNERTWAALEEAERLAGFMFVVTQGSYNAGAVAASGGTHDGGGTVDVRTRDLTSAQKSAQTWAMRTVGFAYWPRFAWQGFAVDHGHGVLKGDRDLSDSAAAQVRAFEAGRDGLRGNRRDTTVDPFRGVTWEKYLAGRQAAGDLLEDLMASLTEDEKDQALGLLQLIADRLGTITNTQLKELGRRVGLIETRMDNLVNHQIPGLRADADRGADKLVGPDQGV